MPRPRISAALLVGALAGPAFAQQGDRAGETQPPLPDDLDIPPAPVRSAAESLDLLVVKDGFRVELVASEPLVEDPVAIAFDGAGRLWVVEMRGFMPNVDGTQELEPVGRIVVLDDTDGDGAMDVGTVFLDELVLPRAVAPAYGGALVIEPPDLVFHRDADGDGRADERRVLYTGFGGRESPEHAGNGLLQGLDNWYYCSQHPLRFRFDGVEIEAEVTPGHGQWGLTRDDVGRLFYTTNSDPLRADLFPLHYASRNPNQPGVTGINVRVAHDFSVWPTRVTPGVNRGYREPTLKDGKLVNFTAACGPAIYRGETFPAEFHGNAFVCEPAAQLVKRYVLAEDEAGRLVATPAYERSEFLTSTDERFRPVNACTGPDGALYIVDMYRGILQHRIFMTTFLRKQVIERELDRPIGLGRIYRIVAHDAPASPVVDLDSAAPVELVATLGHPNGWWRDTAQRLLVERGRLDVTRMLRDTMRGSTNAAGRLHALWTLDGLDAACVEDVEAALRDETAAVRASGVRLGERWLSHPRVIDGLSRLVDDPSAAVRTQLAFTLGEVDSAETLALLVALLCRDATRPETRSAVASGLAGRELAFLTTLLARADWSPPAPGHRESVDTLAACVLRSGSMETITGLLALAAGRATASPWQTRVILDRYIAARRLGTDDARPAVLAGEPPAWSALLASADDELSARARTVHDAITWIKDGARASAGPRRLDEQEQLLFKKGVRLYGTHCASCHLKNGRGQEGIAPPLVGTRWVVGSDRRLARILLHGLAGPIEVDGRRFDLEMPRAPTRRVESIAALMTYVRRSWGNVANPVTPERVTEVRDATAERDRPWTVAELDAIGD